MVNAARSGGAPDVSVVAKRKIQACNFRSSAQLSKEGAHHLTVLHEEFARMASSELEMYLGASMEIKLVSLEQLPAHDYIAGVLPSAYLLPYKIAPMQGKMIMEFDSGAISSITDLLLGGTGVALPQERELTEIDEELLKTITAIIVGKLVVAWKAENVSLVAEVSVKPALIGMEFVADGEVLLLMFEVNVAGSMASMNLVFHHSFATFLLRSTELSSTKKKTVKEGVVKRGLKDRLLKCTFTVSEQLPNVSVPIRDLIQLKPGRVLNLRVPVDTPVKLAIDNHDMFVATPVRVGSQKAAQLGAAQVTGKRAG